MEVVPNLILGHPGSPDSSAPGAGRKWKKCPQRNIVLIPNRNIKDETKSP